MTDEKAKELGYTHRAKLYGFKGYYRDIDDDKSSDNTFIADWWLTDKIVEALIYLDVVLEINDYGFPFLLLYKL